MGEQRAYFCLLLVSLDEPKNHEISSFPIKCLYLVQYSCTISRTLCSLFWVQYFSAHGSLRGCFVNNEADKNHILASMPSLNSESNDSSLANKFNELAFLNKKTIRLNTPAVLLTDYFIEQIGYRGV